MFGFGMEARQRREAVKLIRAALDADAQKKAAMQALFGLAHKVSITTPHPTLAERLMGRVSKWTTRRFAGQVLPNASAVGLAIEALSYGINDLAGSPADQQLTLGALGGVLAYAAKHQDQMNDADYEMFQIMGARYVNHPLMKIAGREAA